MIPPVAPSALPPKGAPPADRQSRLGGGHLSAGGLPPWNPE